LSRRSIHFSCRYLALAATVLAVACAGGCALFRKETWNLDHYRDERAVDIDRRLDKAPPIGKNPFNSDH
jgi:hypothetical protein